MGSDNLRSRIQAFRYAESDLEAPQASGGDALTPSSFSPARRRVSTSHTAQKVSKPTSSTKTPGASTVASTGQKARKTLSKPSVECPDLPPSITTDQQILFIGYNPGVESSLQQHHYAHFTNLFWKLFNKSGILQKVLTKIPYDRDDPLLLEPTIRPVHDNDLVRFKIGFTDLVLRCTKTAQELSMAEKLANVPRLLSEFSFTQSRFLIFVGKGIWEIVVKYMATKLGIRLKLSKTNFMWGEQVAREGSEEDVRVYNYMLKEMKKELPEVTRVYVFPNTSGLVASLSWSEKLKHWEDLVAEI